MARSRGGGRTSTGALLAWAALMLALGVGLGVLFSASGCRRRSAPDEAPREAPKGRRKAAPRGPQLRETPSERPQESPAPARPEAVPEPSSKALPKVAVVVDDLGYAEPELVTRLCAQPVPFSVAVLPFLPHSRESAEIAHARGKEVLLHLPMEPLGYPGPGRNPGEGAILFDLPEREVRARVRRALLEVPFRRGVNNHMGSRITPDRTRMTWVMEEIRAAKCFFVDSRTEKDSVAFDVARALKVRAVQRRVFLDDVRSFPEMEKQWERALALARKEGEVLIIGHIYPESVEALERLVSRSRGEVRFVSAGELAR